MIKVNEMRVGTLVMDGSSIVQVNSRMIAMVEKDEAEFDPIPLSEDILLMLGFEKNPNYAIGNPFNLSLGRNKMMVVSSVGTPNEMVFVREENDLNGVADEPDIVVVRNYDYNGKTHLHHIQNIASDFGTELTLNP